MRQKSQKNKKSRSYRSSRNGDKKDSSKNKFLRPKKSGENSSDFFKSLHNGKTNSNLSSGKSFQKYIATFEKIKSGAGFLIFDRPGIEDQYVHEEVAYQYQTGDRVEARRMPRGDFMITKLVNRRKKIFLGRLNLQKGKKYLVHKTKRSEEWFQIHGFQDGVAKAKEGDWILGVEKENFSPAKLMITECFGESIPASADLKWMSGEFGLEEKHSSQAIEEAKKYPKTIPDSEPKRENLTSLPWITIDGETARDFDDAIFVEKENDFFVLWVGIADVSHYVKPRTCLDEEAYQRATSVYFPEKAFHMLPSELSEELCSLKPNVNRYSLVARIVVSDQGEIQKTTLHNAIIKSKRRATYTEIEKERSKYENDKNWEYFHHFKLFHILKNAKTKRGSIDFDLPETKILVDESGEPTEISRVIRNDAHKLIEEFMILANEAVTRLAISKDYPFVYRVHESPSEQSLRSFQELASSVGVKFHPKLADQPKTLSEFLQTMEKHSAKDLLSKALLRSMKQATYRAENLGHFGLASPAYTHFTSPIRRYPDLLVHRMLKKILFEEKIENKDSTTQSLQEASEHCSYRERLASDAERESIRIKQIRYMKRHLGETFLGKVNGLTEKGIFIQLDDPCVEGFIPKERLPEAYHFVESKLQYHARRGGKVIKIGDPMEILVSLVSLEERQILFEPTSALKNKKSK